VYVFRVSNFFFRRETARHFASALSALGMWPIERRSFIHRPISASIGTDKVGALHFALHIHLAKGGESTGMASNAGD